MWYSSCHFPNHKSVFLQILHHSSVSWKIILLYFFRSNVIFFSQKERIKVEILRILSAQVKIYKILVIFETANQFFCKFCITPQCHEAWLFYAFLAEILYTFNKRSLSKYELDEISCEQSKVEILLFDVLLLSKSCKVSAKKIQKSYLSWHWKMMQSLKKNWLVVSNTTWEI